MRYPFQRKWATFFFAALVPVALFPRNTFAAMPPLAIAFDDGRLPFDVRAGGLCLFLLLAAVAGSLALFKKQLLPGILFITGIALIALDPILDFVLFRILVDSVDDKANWAYSILSLLTSAVGYVLISIAFLVLLKRKTTLAQGFPPEMK